MQCTIVILVVILLILYGLPKLGIKLTFMEALKHKKALLVLFIFVLLCVIIYLNRYSILAFIILNHNAYPFFESITKSLSMSNDISFVIGIIQEIAIMKEIYIPSQLVETITTLTNETYGKLGSYSDLLELIKLVW